MKDFFLTIGMSVLALFNIQGVPEQQQDEAVIHQAPQLSELDYQLYQAREASKAGNIVEALQMFENLEENGLQYHYWAAIAEETAIYRKQDNFDKAREVVNRAKQAEPLAAGLMDVWNGDISLQKGDYEQAIADYETAEKDHGQDIVNNMAMGELGLKQAARAAIKYNHPDKAAQYARKMVENYLDNGNPETALARAILYEAMAQGELEVDTLENVLYKKICTGENPCFISKDRKLKLKQEVNQDNFQSLNNLSGLYFELNDNDKESLKRITNKGQSLLNKIIPEAQAADSYETCTPTEETAYRGFIDPIEDIDPDGRDMFMTYPSAAGLESGLLYYHPGSDLNNWYDHVGSDAYDCSNTPYDYFKTAAAGCVQDSSTADWGSYAITHHYVPYDGDYTDDYITSQYGHADEVFYASGAPVAYDAEIGSIGGVGGAEGYPCHLHFEIREPDHPDPYNAGYWGGTLFTQDNTGLWYNDPETFIDGHPGYDWAVWLDEGSSWWDYDPTWEYVDTKGNGNEQYENDLKYTSTTSSATATATATLGFEADESDIYYFHMFVPWSMQTKSDSAPVELTKVSDGSSIFSDNLDFYGTTVTGEGTCDEYDAVSGTFVYSDTKRCDEWIVVGSAYLIAGEEYELTISNNTGSDDDIIIIDDFIITQGDGTAAATTAKVRADGVDPEDSASLTLPESGDWTVSGDYLLETSYTAPGNVIVEDGTTLQIDSGVTLDIDLDTYHISIGDGARVIIKDGGKLD